MRNVSVTMLLVCILAVLSGCNMSPSVWVTEDQELQVDAAGVRRLTVRTDNGSIEHVARNGEAPAVAVKVHKKAGGRTKEDAQEAMKQLEVFCEPQGTDGKLLGYRWKVPKQTQWSATVSFGIDAPAALALDAESTNGEIKVQGVDAEVRAVSHNGEVGVESSGPWVEATSHNGAINVNYAGPKITATTNNGEVKVDLRRCKEVGGTINTHNGAITLRVGKEVSAALSASTSNGGIAVQAPRQMRESKKNYMQGIIGHGGPSLSLETHNGDIDVKQE
jgi:hypothetical protein